MADKIVARTSAGIVRFVTLERKCRPRNVIDTRSLVSLSADIEESPEDWPAIAQAFTALALAFVKLEQFATNRHAA